MKIYKIIFVAFVLILLGRFISVVYTENKINLESQLYKGNVEIRYEVITKENDIFDLYLLIDGDIVNKTYLGEYEGKFSLIEDIKGSQKDAFLMGKITNNEDDESDLYIYCIRDDWYINVYKKVEDNYTLIGTADYNPNFRITEIEPIFKSE